MVLKPLVDPLADVDVVLSQSNRSGFETLPFSPCTARGYTSQSNRSGFETRSRRQTTTTRSKSQSNRSGFETHLVGLVPHCRLRLNPTVVVLKPHRHGIEITPLNVSIQP